MEILGIGAPEFAFIIIIALIVLGPKDMQKAGKTIGKWLRDLVTSDGWKVFQQTSREVRNLPTRLMREANDEMDKIKNIDPASSPAGNRFNPHDMNPGSKPDLPPASTSIPASSPNPAPQAGNATPETSKPTTSDNA